MEQLAVKLILARSPQAKGRVERMNGTLQVRLVKALRQRGISDLASAIEFLEPGLSGERRAAEGSREGVRAVRRPCAVVVGDRDLTYGTTCSEPLTSRRRPPRPPKSSQGNKPSPTHPWRGKRRELAPT